MIKILKSVLVAGYIILLILPVWVFFSNRGGLAAFSGLDFKNTLSVLFPLVGLLAFSFLSIQFLIGSNRRLLQKIFPGIVKFHRYHGLMVFVLATLHPLMLLSGLGIATYIDTYLKTSRLPFALLGVSAWTLLCVTVITALGAWKLQKFQGVWRKIHILNYLVFILVWFHSWFLGSDVQTSMLKYVWLLYGALAVISILARLKLSYKKSQQATVADNT